MLLQDGVLNPGEIVAGKVATAGGAPGLALRDTCLRAIDQADTILGSAGRSSPHRAIHQARKGIRRARAALALLGIDHAAGTIDTALKRLARTLSRVRDAAVAVESYDRMVKHAALQPVAALLRPLRVRLVSQRDAMLSVRLQRDPAFEQLRTRLRAVREKVRILPWSSVDVDAVAHGVNRAARRAGKIGARAKHRFEENLRHRWRRRLRRLNDQRVVIEKLVAGEWPENTSDRHRLAVRLERIESKNSSSWHRLTANVHALGLEHDARLLRRIARTTAAIDGTLRDQLVAALNRRLYKLHMRTTG
jgi:hypothetical protein